MATLLAIALALWGWNMPISIEVGQPSQSNWGAEAWPQDDLSSCRIVVAPNTDDSVLPGLILHEVGHCIGHRAHGDGIMGHDYTASISVANRLTVKAYRDARLSNRVTVPGLAR